jgi:hypothetical protein
MSCCKGEQQPLTGGEQVLYDALATCHTMVANSATTVLRYPVSQFDCSTHVCNTPSRQATACLLQAADQGCTTPQLNQGCTTPQLKLSKQWHA